ncbi:MAG: glycosyltransferase family 2 protein [Planctomycetota bacterium]
MIRFSVIIPVFNRGRLVQEAIESVLAQSHADYELIVVDDGSTDDTPQRLEHFADRVRVLRQDNAGVSAARNRGADEARGDYLLFLDSDDLWFPWTLNTFARLIAEHDHPALIAGNGVTFTDAMPDGDDRFDKDCVQIYADFPRYRSSSNYRWFNVSGLAIRRDIWVDTGGFDPALCTLEDVDWLLRTPAGSGFIRAEAPTLFAYRRHTDSLTADFGKQIRSLHDLLERERRGVYGQRGADTRARRWVLAAEVRHFCRASLRRGELALACGLYRRTLAWQFLERRVRFLMGFPVATAAGLLRRRTAPATWGTGLP